MFKFFGACRAYHQPLKHRRQAESLKSSSSGLRIADFSLWESSSGCNNLFDIPARYFIEKIPLDVLNEPPKCISGKYKQLQRLKDHHQGLVKNIRECQRASLCKRQRKWLNYSVNSRHIRLPKSCQKSRGIRVVFHSNN